MQNDFNRLKNSLERSTKYVQSIERQCMNAVEENKELKIKVEDCQDLTKRHFDKIKELCVVLDKITEENKKLKAENDNQNKQLRNTIENKSNFLESKLDE